MAEFYKGNNRKMMTHDSFSTSHEEILYMEKLPAIPNSVSYVSETKSKVNAVGRKRHSLSIVHYPLSIVNWKKLSIVHCALLIVFCLFFGNTAFAQMHTVGGNMKTIGTETSTSTSSKAPVDNYYRYTYTQILYTASELGATSGTINSIGFQYAYATAMTAKTNVEIYMGNTSKTSFSSNTDNVTSGLTLVYSGNLNCSQGWNDFPLSSGFSYSGGGLIVTILDKSNNYNSSSYTFTTTSTSSYMTKAWYSDSYSTTNYTSPNTSMTKAYYQWRPNTRFSFGNRSYLAPVNNYYCYTYSQVLYTAAELGSTAGVITTIGYQYAYSEAMTKKNNVEIYMGNTSKTSFSSNTDVVASGQTLVYSGPLNCSPGWNDFDLDAPFNYTGGGLIVTVLDKSGNYDGTEYVFSTTQTTNYMTIAWYNDSYKTDDYTSPNTSMSKGYYQWRPNTRFNINPKHYDLPVNNWYKYTYSQVLYKAADVGGQSGLITSIGYQYAYSTAMKKKTNVEIYMGNTSKTSFSSNTDNVTSGLTLVYSGNLNCSQGWNDFELTTPFEYTGGGLIVTVLDKSGQYDGQACVFATTPTTDKMSKSWYSDSYSTTDYTSPNTSMNNKALYQYRPNTRFHVAVKHYDLPVNNYYKYTYSQVLYKAADLGNSGCGNITHIGYQYASSTAMTAKTNVEIYMGNTSKTSFTANDDNVTSGLTLVYSGNLNCSQGWNDFELNTPFRYMGGGLIVTVLDKSGSYNGSSYYFGTSPTTSCMSKSWYSDSYSTTDYTSPNTSMSKDLPLYRPNTRFTVTSLSSPCDGVIAMTCGQTYSGTLGASCGLWDTYTDCSWEEPGEERVYSFTPSLTGEYTFTAEQVSGDPDFLLMSSCGTSGTNYTGNWNYGNKSKELTAGTTYYLIVDNADYQEDAEYEVSVSLSSISSVTASASTVCKGSTVTLTAPAGGSSYSWNVSGSGYRITPTVTANTTTYLVTVWSGSSCSASSSVDVAAVDKANPTFASATYCVGTSASFPTVTATDPVTGSTLTGSWTPSSISTASAGTTSYTFTAGAGQCANQGTHSVEVKAKANPTFADATYCVGTSASFPTVTATDPVTGSTLTGSWTPSSISTASAGTTSYTFTAGTGQCSNTGTHSVTINAPSVGTLSVSPQTICPGTSTTLTVISTSPTASEGLAYAWPTGYGSSAETSSILAEGSYTVTVTATNIVNGKTCQTTGEKTGTVTYKKPSAGEISTMGLENGNLLWTGHSTDWSAENNWMQYSTAGGGTYTLASMPTNSSNVVIGSYSDCISTPTLNIDATANAGTLKIASGTIVSGENVINMYGNIVNNGTFDAPINFAGTTALSGSGTTTLRDVTISNRFDASSASMTISGNWTNNGIFNANGPVVFAGASAQTIGGSNATTFNNVTFNNGNGISISKEPTINGTATFTSGIVTGDVTFGASASATVSDYTSYVDGTVTKTLGSSAFTFPTGSNGVLGSVTVSATRAGGSATIKFNKSALLGGFDQENDGYPRWWNINDMCTEDGANRFDHVSNAEYWDITTTATLANVTFRAVAATDVHFNDTSINQRDPEAIRFALYDGCWKNMEGSASVTGGNSDLSVSNVTIPATGRAPYKGTFGSLDDNTVLPIELVSFTATCDGHSTLVEWTTATERNNDYFSLERSDDAINFTEIARVAGAGNSIEPLDYSYTDYGIHGGDNYYRLVQVDYDGTRTASEIIVANCIEPEVAEPDVQAYPNPFNDELTVVLDNFGNRAATIEVYDMLGKLIYTNKIAAPQNSYETILNLSNLPPAAYTVRVSTTDFVINRNVVKQ